MSVCGWQVDERLIVGTVLSVMYRDRWTARPSFCSSSSASTKRTMASSLGKMPTTSVRRLISPFDRSIGLFKCNLVQCALGKISRRRCGYLARDT